MAVWCHAWATSTVGLHKAASGREYYSTAACTAVGRGNAGSVGIVPFRVALPLLFYCDGLSAGP